MVGPGSFRWRILDQSYPPDNEPIAFKTQVHRMKEQPDSSSQSKATQSKLTIKLYCAIVILNIVVLTLFLVFVALTH